LREREKRLKIGRSEQLSLVKTKDGKGEKIDEKSKQGQREKERKKERRTRSPNERITSALNGIRSSHQGRKYHCFVLSPKYMCSRGILSITPWCNDYGQGQGLEVEKQHHDCQQTHQMAIPCVNGKIEE